MSEISSRRHEKASERLNAGMAERCELHAFHECGVTVYKQSKKQDRVSGPNRDCKERHMND